jgi:hypothetical protein
LDQALVYLNVLQQILLRACPIVDKGVYAPSFKPPPAYPKPLDASVFVPIRERIFSLAKNKSPFGFFISAKNFVKRATSSSSL